MSKHIPGPWELDWEAKEISYKGSMVVTLFDADDFPCIDEAEYNEVNAEYEATARLIAAAPELLEACEGLVKAADQGERSFYHAAARANAAIAKARGES